GVHRRWTGDCNDCGEPELEVLFPPCPLWLKEGLMEVKKVGVLGCGLMGSGIAQVAATAGFDVTVLEVEQKFLDRGFAAIETSLAKLAEKGTLKETPEAVRPRLKGTTKREDLA